MNDITLDEAEDIVGRPFADLNVEVPAKMPKVIVVKNHIEIEEIGVGL